MSPVYALAWLLDLNTAGVWHCVACTATFASSPITALGAASGSVPSLPFGSIGILSSRLRTG
jgi:hypothetical protein